MNAFPATEGPRACRPDELHEMISMTNSVMRQGSSQSFLTDYPLVYTPENLRNVQIIKAGDTIVSVVPYIPKQIDYAGTRFQIGIISPTATHPEHRRLGHARRCLDSCLSLMETAGTELSVLWTLPATFPFYEQAGFQAVPPQLDWVYCTKDDTLIFKDRGYCITSLDLGNITQLRAITTLHDNGFSGITRSTRDTEALFSLPRTTTYLAYDNMSNLSGYLLHCDGTHKPGILEAEGKPESIESLIHHVLRTSTAEKTPIYLIKTAHPLTSLVHQWLPARIQPMDSGPMMIRINDPRNFLTSIQSWLEVHQSENKVRYSLEITDAQQIIGFDYDPVREQKLILTEEKTADHHTISRRELTELIFGSRQDNPLLPAATLNLQTPFHFPVPMLDHS